MWYGKPRMIFWMSAAIHVFAWSHLRMVPYSDLICAIPIFRVKRVHKLKYFNPNMAGLFEGSFFFWGFQFCSVFWHISHSANFTMMPSSSILRQDDASSWT